MLIINYNMVNPLNILIVEKSGNLKSLSIKDFKEEELYKKCSFKKPDDFIKQTEWNIKTGGNKYTVHVYAKSEGRANNENKYDFPPPIDTKLFFGNCAIVAYLNENGKKVITNLTIPIWEKFYEKLFGGFEDLSSTAIEDENEEDELAKIPKEKKTKHGYLKDGFVVDSSETDEDVSTSTYDNQESETADSESDETEKNVEIDLTLDEFGSELSEESYDYDTDDNDK